jgi:hypothetical protein
MSEQALGVSPVPTFYLVLKGEVAIFPDPATKRLRLLAPHVPGHVYTAGPWLSPFGIPKGHRLKLENVQGGQTTPADCGDFLVRLPNARPRSDLARFEIDVPMPKAILAGAVQDASHVEVTICINGCWQPLPQKLKFTCLAAILVYAWDGAPGSEPMLTDCDSRRSWKCGGKLQSFRSMHVSASGETAHEENDEQHAREAFIKAAEVLDVTADIKFDGGGSITPTMPPPGLAYMETNASYFETLELGQALGEILEGGRGVIPDIHGPIHFQGGNCGPIGG